MALTNEDGVATHRPSDSHVTSSDVAVPETVESSPTENLRSTQGREDTGNTESMYATLPQTQPVVQTTHEQEQGQLEQRARNTNVSDTAHAVVGDETFSTARTGVSAATTATATTTPAAAETNTTNDEGATATNARFIWQVARNFIALCLQRLLHMVVAQWTFTILMLVETLILGHSFRRLGVDLALFVITMGIQQLWMTVHVNVESTSSNATRPPVQTVLGRYFTPPPGKRVASHAKLLYIVVKCIESFFLSLSPFYSTARLESELQLDGIVRERGGAGDAHARAHAD